ncbi:hypothetical protein C1646_751287, partial [Rhizophagus diaphanus]
MTNDQQRQQFIRGLNPMNQHNIRMMAKFNETQDNITEALSEAERWIRQGQLGIQTNVPPSPAFHPASSFVQQQQPPPNAESGMTKTQIENLVKNSVAAAQQQITQPAAPAPLPKFGPLPSGTKKKVEVDSDEELADLTKKQLKLHVAKAIKKVAKLQYQCSVCNKTGHNARNCPKRKKKKGRSKKGKVNLVIDDSDSDTSSSCDDSSSDNSSESGTDSSSASESEKSSPKKTSKSTKKSKSRKSERVDVDAESPVITPRKSRRSKQTISEDTIRKIVQTQPDPLIIHEPPPVVQESDDEDEYLDDPMEIDFVQKKEPKTSIASVK